MSLRSLVEHIQTHFGDFRGLPGVSPGGSSNATSSSTDVPVPQASRAPLPTWLREPESLNTTDRFEPWVIEGEVPPPDPPSGVDEWGADVLAFYLPFHFYRDDWGIYLRASGIVYLACVLKGAARLRVRRTFDELAGRRYSALFPGDEKFLHLAEQVLLEHEAFHFVSEIAASRSELIAKKAVYSSYFSNQTATAHEEALANAQALTHGLKRQSSPIEKRMSDWMKGQGVGYRDFHRWLSVRQFSEGLSRASDFMLATISPRRETAGLADFVFRGARGFAIPTKRLEDIVHGAAGVLLPFEKDFGLRVRVHSNDHPPPHIHVEWPLGNRKMRRYAWPDLSPFRGQRLPTAAERKLRTYVKTYYEEIQARISTVYGQA